MPLDSSAPSPIRSTMLVLLVAALVVVGAMLGYEAHAASRAQRRTVQGALDDYVATVAWEYESSLRAAIEDEWGRAFGIVTAGRAMTSRDPLVSLEQLRENAAGALACANGEGDESRAYARLELATGTLVTAPAALATPTQSRLAAALGAARATLPLPDRPITAVWPDDGSDRVTLVAVRYARLEVPVALYAIDACASALQRRIPAAVARGRRIPTEAIAGGTPPDSLVALALRDASGRTLYAAGTLAEGGPHASVPLTWLGPFTLALALRPEAERHLLLVPGEAARVPLLIGLLALFALLAAVAIAQVRREQRLTRLQADFTSSVSHELRTPLAQILLFGETLSLERTRTADERRFAAETIVREARRLMQLVDNILQFAQHRQGRPALHLTVLPLAAVVREVVASFEALATSRGSRLAFEGDGEARVLADREALRQVTLNLLDNATKYGGRAQLVRVTVESEGGAVRLAVADEGSGIAVSDRERIWHPYVRLGARAGTAGGSGLGLAVVRELAEAMGGRVEVGDAPGGGARFVVEFPVAAASPAPHGVASPAAPAPSLAR